MAEDSDEEKTESPTARRLEKAREEGQIPRSRELTTLMLLCAGLAGLWLLAGQTGAALAAVMRTSLGFSAEVAFDPARMMSQLWLACITAIEGLAPLLAVLALTALIAPTLLGGWLFSGKSIKLDFARLNFFKGVKKLFSVQSATELLKAVAKSLVIGAVAAWFIYDHLDGFIALAAAQGKGALIAALRLVFSCCAFMLLGFVVVVLIDVPYQLWSHHKKLRMSRDEIKKENKESEGDPQLKSRIRSQQQAMARKRMFSEIQNADVIVTNPTHFAVALAYRDQDMHAPKVVAKGADHVAERIRARARECAIPLLAAPPLARALYRHAELDREIPAALYGAVAQVLAWVYQLKRYRADGGQAPDTPAAIAVPAGFDSTPAGRAAP